MTLFLFVIFIGMPIAVVFAIGKLSKKLEVNNDAPATLIDQLKLLKKITNPFIYWIFVIFLLLCFLGNIILRLYKIKV